MVGGLVTSTLLDQIVTPALFHKFGRKIYARRPAGGAGADDSDALAQLV